MSKLFDVDFQKLPVMLLPTFMRRPALVSAVRLLSRPLATLNARRAACRADALFAARHTGQVCYLKAALNYVFNINDPAEGFGVEDPVPVGEFLIAYNETPSFASRHVIAASEYDTNAELAIAWSERAMFTTKTFIVTCPASVFDDKGKMARVKKIVNRYRLVSRQAEYMRR